MYTCPKFRVLSLLIALFTCGLLSAQLDRPMSAGSPISIPQATYDGASVGLLNKAYRQYRSGLTQEALMTYDAILGKQANWLPALTGKAELLRRLGRDTEADRYRKRAVRIDPLATGFLLSRGRNGLLRYLALYPQDAIPLAMDVAAADLSEDTYFDQQLRVIMNLPDTAYLAVPLRAKVAGDRIKSIQTLHTLIQDEKIASDLGFMLEGNLDMLNHDYLGAVAAYNQAIDFHQTNWPEITYNRGLAFIMLDNYNNGCSELKKSAEEGFEPALKMLTSLCSF